MRIMLREDVLWIDMYMLRRENDCVSMGIVCQESWNHAEGMSGARIMRIILREDVLWIDMYMLRRENDCVLRA